MLLTYVGITGPSVERRRKLDGYRKNKLMTKIWDKAAPSTLIAYNLPNTKNDCDKSKVVLYLAEFLIVNMIEKISRCGFNQQPGGTFSFTAKRWMIYDKAKEYVHGLELAGQVEWYTWYNKNWAERDEMCLPTHPERNYPNEFEGWYKFLGNDDTVTVDNRVDYKEAERIVQEIGFKSKKEWFTWCKSKSKKETRTWFALPSCKAYPDEWKDWFTFLGNADTSVTVDSRVCYRETKRIVQEMSFESSREWHAWCKANPKKRQELGLPCRPDEAYPNEWKDWFPFLGNEDTSVTADNRVDYKEAE